MSCVSLHWCNKSFWSMKVVNCQSLCWGRVFLCKLFKTHHQQWRHYLQTTESSNCKWTIASVVQILVYDFYYSCGVGSPALCVWLDWCCFSLCCNQTPRRPTIVCSTKATLNFSSVNIIAHNVTAALEHCAVHLQGWYLIPTFLVLWYTISLTRSQDSSNGSLLIPISVVW